MLVALTIVPTIKIQLKGQKTKMNVRIVMKKIKGGGEKPKTFKEWMEHIEKIINNFDGDLEISDLPDDYLYLYVNRYSPLEAAMSALKENGYPVFYEETK